MLLLRFQTALRARDFNWDGAGGSDSLAVVIFCPGALTPVCVTLMNRTSGLFKICASGFLYSVTSPLPGNGGLDNTKQDNTQQEAEEGGASAKNKHFK